MLIISLTIFSKSYQILARLIKYFVLLNFLPLDRLAHHARVVICGGISRYNEEGELPGPKNYFNLIYYCARMQGFLAHDYADRFDEFYPQMEQWVRSGEIKQRETVVEGFQNLPKALVALFDGANTGKMMVHVS